MTTTRKRVRYSLTPGKRPGVRFFTYKGEWWAVDAMTLERLHEDSFDSRATARHWVKLWKQDPQSAYDWVGPYMSPEDVEANAENTRAVFAHMMAGGCGVCGATDHDEDACFSWPIKQRHGLPYYIKKAGTYEARVRGDGPPGGPFFYHWAIYRGHRAKETLAAGPTPTGSLEAAQSEAQAALEHFTAHHAPN